MGRKWKSYLYVPVLAMALAISGMYLTRDKIDANINNQQQVYHLDEYFQNKESVPPEAHAVDEQNVILEQKSPNEIHASAQFILRIENDFVVVYKAENENEHFMLTGISISDLPEVTIEELKVGKEIQDEEALYFFLESYSS